MATEPPGKHPDPVEEPDDRAGIWQVAPARWARAMPDSRLTAQRRVGQDFIAVPNPSGPAMASDRAGGDLDAVLPGSRSWPRVFPGL